MMFCEGSPGTLGQLNVIESVSPAMSSSLLGEGDSIVSCWGLNIDSSAIVSAMLAKSTRVVDWRGIVRSRWRIFCVTVACKKEGGMVIVE